MPKVKSKFSHITWLREREISHRFPLGSADNFYTRLYTSLYPVGAWDHRENLRNAVHGGVFNLEFSPDGKLLVAACEKKSILMFDPLSQRMIHGIDDAHTECVNCVRFLDSRVFATCSDDTTVALWDARNLKQRIHTLRGHKNWVKNIEFSAKDGLLVTSGFDGSIYTWDINNYTEKRVFHTNGLMRTRLNPDASKMIICTTAGYLMIIHDLDLANLSEDLAGFKPNMYRLMQQNQTVYPGGVDFSHLFSRRRKRNRVEFITDFPKRVDAEVISSLQVHPQGWCALSRHVSNDETSEWTCVHNIQEIEEGAPDLEPEENYMDGDHDNREAESPGTAIVASPPRHPPRPPRRGDFRSDDEDSRRIQRVGEIVRRGGTYTANVELHVSSSDVWEAIVAVREARMSRQRGREAANSSRDNQNNRFANLMNQQLEAEGPREGFHNVTGSVRNTTEGSPADTLRDGQRSFGTDPAASREEASQSQFPDRSWHVVRNEINPRLLANGANPIPIALDNPIMPGSVLGSVPTFLLPPSSAAGSESLPPRNFSPDLATSPNFSPSNYEALASALRRNEELRAARLARLQDIDVSQQLPLLQGLAASMGGHSLGTATDHLVSLSHPHIPIMNAVDARDFPNDNIANSAHNNHFNNTTRDALRGSFLPRVERVSWRVSGANSIVVPAGEGSSVDISISTRPRSQDGDGDDVTSQVDSSQRTTPFLRSDDPSARTSSSSFFHRVKVLRKYQVHQNIPRLLNFIEEPNVGKGFIKELCFSSDGRLICSPFAFGVRLLAFTPDCSELSTSVLDTPRQLYELKTNICHGNTVVSTKFSPQHCLLVSGCLNGKIVWHQPNVW